MSLSLPLRAGLDSPLAVAWDDGECIVYRGSRTGSDGEQTAVT